MSARIRNIQASVRAAYRICSAAVKREDLPDLVSQPFTSGTTEVKGKPPAAINQLETEYRFA
jgi:hypothetical protein